MSLKDKYTNKTKNEPNKEVIGDDAYAVCEFIELLIEKIGAKHG